MGMCIYCSGRPADSDDHIFPQFLGGKKTVAACRVCNSKFGHIFEGPAARELEPIYVLLAKWGVPLSPRERLWRNAFEVSGARLHLGVGSDGVRAQSAKPIFTKDAEGRIVEALFADAQQLAAFKEAMNHRYPDQTWAPTEKIVRTDLNGLQLKLRLGWAVQQLALKMAIAAASCLPATEAELRAAASTLHDQPCEYHQRVSSDFRRDTTALARPPLSHLIYVERSYGRISAIVEFFGAIRYFVHLADGLPTPAEAAMFGYVDPVDCRERFEVTSCLPLGLPPGGYTMQQFVAIQLDIVRLLAEGARARGATVLPGGEITVRLPIAIDVAQ